MKRRNFIKKLPILGSFPFVLSGIPMRVMSSNMPLQQLAAMSSNDKVLIILQLHGGNDGLNMLIPVANYDLYQFRRANIAIPARNSNRKFIPLDSTIPLKDQVGLHPDMIGMKELYDQGKVAIVQGVSYENNNGSHFRGRDILFMGGGSEDYLSSGWIGRYLENEFPNYPAAYPSTEMPDPLALEFGNNISLIFHQSQNIPASISIDNPNQFFDLVENLEGFEDLEGIDPRGIPPQSVESSPYGKELNWILGLEQKSDDYAARLKQLYDIGDQIQSNVVYPEIYPFNAPPGISRNSLSGQLKIISRLISGGSKTKVYLVRLGGFDTHAEQVESYDPTMGVHAALMYHISSAMKAFQDDLKARGVEDRVLTITTSEFGRRIFSNGSYGTDHGTGAPLLMFGKWVIPGVNGTVPNLNEGNVEKQFDYRQIYSTILKDWFEVDAQLVDGGSPDTTIIHGDYEGRGDSMPLINKNFITSTEDFILERYRLNDCYPNPAKTETVFSFKINRKMAVNLKLYDLKGQLVKTILNWEEKEIGEHKIKISLKGLNPGTYIYRIESKNGLLQGGKQLIIQ
ncbi:MAG: DUF1501 domain-containing protein [Microscillaceae bacterium]|nr:DUF1501 domain-containing protein [Microscillaceae bacterium]